MWPMVRLWPLSWLQRRRGERGDTLGRARLGTRRWRRRVRRAGEALASDCEAYLSGRLAERMAGTVGSVPAWAWTNLLAHGTLADLAGEARKPLPGPGSGELNWRRARAYLAGVVLREAGARGRLSELQRRVLVPLELEIAGSAPAVTWWPGQWMAAVEKALHEAHRAGHSQ